MTYTTILTTSELVSHINDPSWIIVDARFSLAQPDLKQAEYRHAHIPGAVYAHLDHDLSAPKVPGLTGRHPLPTPDAAASMFGQLGIAPGMQVAVYDDQGGALAAVRVWWMLRWLGHTAAAVLDGGWQQWLKEDRPVRSGAETRPVQVFIPTLNAEMVVTAEGVERIRQDPTWRLVDARAPERYRGEVEPIDPVAGHIPGAHNLAHTRNLDAAGKFRPASELREIYRSLLGDIPPERVAVYCGSGVTSIALLLSMELAGLPGGKLYAGSWSEWIADPSRPVGKL